MTIIMLAAGLSSRMEGKNKLLLPYRGKPLILSTLEAVLKFSDNILLVLGHEREEIEKILPKNIRTVYNENYEKGQITSIYKALEEVDDDLMILPSDLPLLSPRDFSQIHDALKTSRIARPYHKGIMGHPVGMRKEIRDLVLKERPEKIKEFLEKNGMIKTEGSIATITDIDTPPSYLNLIRT